MKHDDDTAGGLMNTDTITIRPDVTLDVVLKYLRLKKDIPQNTDNIIVVDRYNHYLEQSFALHVGLLLWTSQFCIFLVLFQFFALAL